MRTNNTVNRLTVSAVIAALYCALTLALPFMTFGSVQCRFSEALTILPVFTPAAVPGLAVGCVVSNAVGLAAGANVAGAWDILLGTVATLLAAVCTRLLRKYPLLATLPPVLFNALIIGTELTLVLYDTPTFVLWIYNVLSVGAGQAIACIGGGMLVHTAIHRTTALKDMLK